MIKTFEELWELCEEYHNHSSNEVESVIEELILKCNLYKTINQFEEIPADEKEKMKLSAIGEILFTLTNISLIDKLNVFKALYLSLNSRK